MVSLSLLWGNTDNVVLPPGLRASSLLRHVGKPGVELTRNGVVDEALIPHLQERRTAPFTLLQSPMDVKGLQGALAATCTAPV